ncbi:response regulator [Aquimarina sp. W85]|uniref:response regulator n=1 Tax=Aquimarina rhodophyticola TaxID=3342246 RepID=UPI00366CB7F0
MSQKLEKICIIDDDKIYVNLITKIIRMRKLSEDILIFKNGKEAIEFFVNALERNKQEMIPDVILLDLNMPIMDGWEFLQEFHKIKDQIQERYNLYVVSSSIDSRDVDRAKAIDFVRDYLTKPIKIQDFEKLLSN